ncbi:MAG: glycosyltransferase family 39 protein [Candidatus Schekmanbacteria bacterium]|nr:glycosyltransferase family 39 protein [Candidatus Schekmanbacteria bacterium]
MNRKAWLLLLAGYLLAYIIPLGARPLFSADETRYAEIPREMLVTGDWIVPRLDDLRYFEKPPLGYWLTALSVAVFGESAFAVRLPSAVAAGLAAFALAGFVRAQRVPAGVPLATASVFLSSVLVFGVAVVNVLDSGLALFLSLAQMTFYHGYTRVDRRAQLRWFALSGVAAGVAFLVKGFLVFAVIGSVVAPFLLWQRDLRALLRFSLTAGASALASALPWSLAVHAREPDYWRYFFWVEHVQRFLTPDKGQHPEPLGYFVPVLLAGALPWTLVALFALPELRRVRPHGLLARFTCCWFVLPFAFFSLSSGKLATYIAPCFAPLAVLVTETLGALPAAAADVAFRRAGRAVASVGAVVAIAVVAVQWLPAASRVRFTEAEWWKCALLVAGLGAWGLGSLIAGRQLTGMSRLAGFAAAHILVLLAAQLAFPATGYRDRVAGPLLARIAADVAKDDVLVSDPYRVSAMCWFLRRDHVLLMDELGELGYGASYEPDHLLWPARVREQLAAEGGSGVVWYLTDLERFQRYAPLLPSPEWTATSGTLVLARYRVRQDRDSGIGRISGDAPLHIFPPQGAIHGAPMPGRGSSGRE